MRSGNLEQGRSQMVNDLERLFKKAKNKWNKDYEELVSGIKFQANWKKIENEMRAAENQGEFSYDDLIQNVMESQEKELM